MRGDPVKDYALALHHRAERGCLDFETILVMFKNRILEDADDVCRCECHYSGPVDPVGWNGEYHRYVPSQCDHTDAAECAGRKS
jgi:hypothetical protein